MTPLSIAIIAHLKYPIREPFSGGLEMHTHLLAESLIKRGHRVTLFASTKTNSKLGTVAICEATELDNIGTEEARDIAFFKEHHAYLHLMMRLRKEKFDIVHNNSLHYLPVSLADALPMPMVTTLHTPPFCWLESGIACSLHVNNHYVAISRTLQRMWQRILPCCQVIPNGIDLKNFAFFKNASQDKYAIWYGRIVPEKGLHHAMDACTMAGMPLKIAGPIGNQAYYEQEILPRFTPNLHYLGHINHKELADYIAKAQLALCTPCWEEPFGLVVVEALAVGVPVVGFHRGALPEILTEKCGILAKANDAKALSQAIGQALLLKREDCRARAEEIANSETMIDHYESLYYSILQKNKNYCSKPADKKQAAA